MPSARSPRSVPSPWSGDVHANVPIVQGPVVERWSYPGWSLESSEFGQPTPEQKTPQRVSTLYVSPNYFRTFGVVSPTNLAKL